MVPQRKIYYHCLWGQLSTTCSNATGATQWGTPRVSRPQLSGFHPYGFYAGTASYTGFHTGTAWQLYWLSYRNCMTVILAFIYELPVVLAFIQELPVILAFIQKLNVSYSGFHTGTASYTCFHTCRPDKTGAGVSVFIENCYTHRLMLPSFHRVMNNVTSVW